MKQPYVALFGTLRALDADRRPVAFPTTKTKALLGYLCVKCGEAVGRDSLIGLLWPDRAEKQARNSLSRALSDLRGAFDEKAPFPLKVSAMSLTFDGSNAGSDVPQFLDLIESEENADLELAATLYRGPLMADIELREPEWQAWLDYQRRHFERLAIETNETLLERYETEGNWPALQKAARRLLEIDRTNENAYRVLMRCERDAGQRTRAIRLYRECCEVLAREFEVEPEASTQALYSEIMHAAVEVVAPPAPLQLPERPSIAVLPFDVFGKDEELAWIGDGLAEDLITALSYWRWFPVVARNSSFAYGGAEKDLRRVGAELGARYIVEGSIRGSDGPIRVSVQLIDCEDGQHVWARLYDLERTELLKLQSDVAAQIVASLEPEIQKAEARHLEWRRSNRPSAFEYFILARDIERRPQTRETNAAARSMVERAISEDPDQSHFHALLAQLEWYSVVYGWAEDIPGMIETAIARSRHAVDLDGTNYLGRAVLGVTLLFGKHLADLAIEELQQAVSLNPSSADAKHFLACAYEFGGRPNDALPHLHHVLRLDPQYRHQSILFSDLSLTSILLGRFADAAKFARQSIVREPTNPRALQRLLAALAAAGEEVEVAKVRKDLRDVQPDFDEAYVRRTYPFSHENDLKSFLATLRQASAFN